jgi:hypothetical protein
MWTSGEGGRILKRAGNRRMKKLILGIVALAAIVVVAAAIWRLAGSVEFYSSKGISIPADKGDYVGKWTAPGHILTIEASGQIHYERHENNSTNVTLDLPIQKFVGDDFVVGVFFWTTTFHVTAPPHREDEVWRMTSDGVDYTHPQGDGV